MSLLGGGRSSPKMRRLVMTSALIGLVVLTICMWEQFNTSSSHMVAEARRAVQSSDSAEHYAVQTVSMPTEHCYHGGGMNESATVVGAKVLPTGSTQAFIWHHSTILELPTGSPHSFALDINNTGTAVGGTQQRGGIVAVAWTHQNRVDLGALLMHPNSVATTVNDAGTIAGRCYSGDGSWPARPTNAIVWKHGVPRVLPLPLNCTSSSAYSINDANDVAGWTLTDNHQTHAMLYNKGMSEDLGTLPGGSESHASAVNDRCLVVGDSELTISGEYPWQPSHVEVHASAWQDGRVYDLGVPSSSYYSKASCVNSSAQIAGYYTTYGPGDRRAFIWDSAHGMRDLNTLSTNKGWLIEEAFAIKNDGKILAYAKPMGRSGEKCLVVLTPGR